MPEEQTVCIDLEAGLKSVQGWKGDSLPIRRFADAVDIACLIGGANPAAQPEEHFSEAHHAHLRGCIPNSPRGSTPSASSSSTASPI